MTLDTIGDFNALAELAPDWGELVQHSAAASPFVTPEWLLAWWKHLAGPRALHVLAVRDDDGRLMALAPLLVARGPLGVGSRLEFLGTGQAGSDYLDMIVRAGHEEEGLTALAEALRDETCALRLTHVSQSAFALRLSDSLSQHGWTWQRTNVNVCPIIALAGHTWDSYLGSLGASHRANFRRRLRRLIATFDMSFEPVSSEAGRRDALDAIVRFHEQRFGAGGTAFLTPALNAFHDEATRAALERGWLRMYVLSLNGAIAAAMYGFLYNGRFYFYQHGFDAQYEPLSVGLVLMGLTIQAALEEGALEFDMLYGTESYKYLWAREERPLLQLPLFPRRLAGLLHRGTADAERTMRTVARRILAIGAARAS